MNRAGTWWGTRAIRRGLGRPADARGDGSEACDDRRRFAVGTDLESGVPVLAVDVDTEQLVPDPSESGVVDPAPLNLDLSPQSGFSGT